jgi:ferrous iron transport protein A
MQLWELQAKHSAVVNAISDNVEDKLASRLAEMGFEPGQNVQCVRRSPFKGPMVVSLGGTVLALEQSIAELISLNPNTTNTI